MQEHKAKVVVTLSTSVNNNAHNLITFWLYAKELLTTSDKLSKKTIFLLCLSEETNPAYNYSRTRQFTWLPNSALMSSDFYTTRMATLRILYEQYSTLMLLFPKHNAPEASLNREKLCKSTLTVLMQRSDLRGGAVNTVRYLHRSSGQTGVNVLLEVRIFGGKITKVRRLVFVSVPGMHWLIQSHVDGETGNV